MNSVPKYRGNRVRRLRMCRKWASVNAFEVLVVDSPFFFCVTPVKGDNTFCNATKSFAWSNFAHRCRVVSLNVESRDHLQRAKMNDDSEHTDLEMLQLMQVRYNYSLKRKSWTYAWTRRDYPEVVRRSRKSHSMSPSSWMKKKPIFFLIEPMLSFVIVLALATKRHIASLWSFKVANNIVSICWRNFYIQ